MADDDETLDYIAEILEIVAETAGVEVEVEVEEEGGTIVAEYLGDGDDLAILIGQRGQSLDAIQHLAHRMAFRGMDERKPLSVNAAGYRERRAAALQAVADQAAEAAIRDGRPVSLDPMARTGAQARTRVSEGAVRR